MTEEILLVDDEPVISRLSRAILAPLSLPMTDVTTGTAALERLAERPPSVMVLDVGLPDMTGIDVLQAALTRHPHLPVIMLTADSEAATAVRALRLGAFDYLTKPVNPEELVHSVERALERQRLLGEVNELRGELHSSVLAQQMGPSPEVAALAAGVSQVASSSMSVLLLGETGSGKEVVARALHAASGRRGPFVAIDCGAIPEALLESELFGHEEGAFTGARRRQRGHFHAAEGGTLFLDEIGNMSPGSQAKLLRVLEDRKLRPLGGAQPVDIDVRVIAATNDSLEDKPNFRRDLYFRLAEFTLRLPPLRARKADIPHLARRFCDEASRELGREALALDGEAIERLVACDWPGNVRQLRNVVRRGVLVCTSRTIRASDLDLNVNKAADAPSSEPPAEAKPPSIRALREVVDEAVSSAERGAIGAALAMTHGRRGDAARLLRIDVKTLYRKMHQYGITVPD